MISAKEWIDRHYPNKAERKYVEIVDLTGLDLTGDLNVSDFSWDTTVIINGNPNLETVIDRKEWWKKTVIALNPAPKGISAQEYLEANLSLSVRQSVQNLNLFDLNLFGAVDLSEFEGLIELDISCNQLTSLILTSSPLLKMLYCYHNQLANLILPINN